MADRLGIGLAGVGCAKGCADKGCAIKVSPTHPHKGQLQKGSSRIAGRATYTRCRYFILPEPGLTAAAKNASRRSPP